MTCQDACVRGTTGTRRAPSKKLISQIRARGSSTSLPGVANMSLVAATMGITAAAAGAATRQVRSRLPITT